MTECQYGCGKELIWDKSRRSDSGKMIPIEKATNEPHNCPNSPYAKKMAGNSGDSSQQQITTPPPAAAQQTMDNSQANLSLAERIGILETQVQAVRDDIAGLIVRLNKLDGGQ